MDHARPVCFARSCSCYYTGAHYCFCETVLTKVAVVFVNIFMLKKNKVLSTRAQLNRQFRRGIMTSFLCVESKRRF